MDTTLIQNEVAELRDRVTRLEQISQSGSEVRGDLRNRLRRIEESLNNLLIAFAGGTVTLVIFLIGLMLSV